MAAPRERHGGMPEVGQAAAPARVGRRGLIAGAAALMAGMIATRTAEPVGATAGGTNGTPLIIGANNDMGNTPNTYTAVTTLRPTSGSTVPATFSPGGVALLGIGQDGAEGLIGVCFGSAGFGVEGLSDRGFGVYGNATSPTVATSYGVYGQSNATAGYGVNGVANGAAATGVFGQAIGTAPARGRARRAPPTPATGRSASPAPPTATPPSSASLISRAASPCAARSTRRCGSPRTPSRGCSMARWW